MKKNIVRRSLSLLCAFALLFSLSISAAAAGYQSDTLEISNGEIIYCEGGLRIEVAVAPGVLPMDLNITDGWARLGHAEKFKFVCDPADGNYAHWVVYNIGTTYMEVAFEVELPGKDPVSVDPRVVAPGDSLLSNAKYDSGVGIDMEVHVSIKAMGGDAKYAFSGTQSWV